jgi:hypothetical protein
MYNRASSTDHSTLRFSLAGPLTPPMPAYISLIHDTCPGGGMVDALASGASVLLDVEVRVLSWAPPLPQRMAEGP